ncbi:MAG: putative molybdenum carrier protein, partial [Mariprofundaceae bacterium]|nr:putative molybdenum carrier protein [Mariprofundaceae bacterium]
MLPIEKIISGGQSGVDRAALDAALQHDLARGGWCPKGRRAEDGRIDERYPLEET